MTVMTQRANDVMVLSLNGELHAGKRSGLEAILLAHLGEDGGWLIVDLSAVTFIDSGGLAALVTAYKAATLTGGRLVLAGLREPVRLIFELTMADGLFLIFATVDEALAYHAA